MEEYRQKDNEAGSASGDLETMLAQMRKLTERNMHLILQMNMLEQANFKYHQGEEVFQKKIKEVRAYATKWTNNFINEV